MILRVGDTQVATAEELQQALANADLQRGVRLHVLREGLKRFVLLKSE